MTHLDVELKRLKAETVEILIKELERG